MTFALTDGRYHSRSSAVLAAINAREKAVRQRQRAVVSEARAEAKVRATAIDGP